MSHLWRVVKLQPLQDDFYAVTHLRQLVEELEDPQGARNHIQHIDLTLPQSRLGGAYSPLEEAVFQQDCIHGLDPDDLVYPADSFIVATLARVLTRQFIECPLLETVKWTGYMQPDMFLLDNLSRCKRLSELSVDIGLIRAKDISSGWPLPPVLSGDKTVKRPPKHDCFPALQKLEFAMDRWWEEDCKCGRGDGIGSVVVPEADGSAFVHTLLEYNAIPKQFILGEHELLKKAWMLPVWVSIEDISWSSVCEIFKERNGWAPDWHEEYWDLMAKTRGLSQFFLKNIDFFEPRTPDSDDMRPRYATFIACDIYNLIQRREELKHLRKLFPRWFESCLGPVCTGRVDTKEELTTVAKVLLSKVLRKGVQH